MKDAYLLDYFKNKHGWTYIEFTTYLIDDMLCIKYFEIIPIPPLVKNISTIQINKYS